MHVEYVFVKASTGKQVRNLRNGKTYDANVVAVKRDTNDTLTITIELRDV